MNRTLRIASIALFALLTPLTTTSAQSFKDIGVSVTDKGWWFVQPELLIWLSRSREYTVALVENYRVEVSVENSVEQVAPVEVSTDGLKPYENRFVRVPIRWKWQEGSWKSRTRYDQPDRFDVIITRLSDGSVQRIRFGYTHLGDYRGRSVAQK